MTWSSEWCLRNAGQCYSTANAPELRARPETESEVAQQEDGTDLARRPLDPEPRPPPPSARLEDESAAAPSAGVGLAATAAIHLAALPLLFIR